MDGGTHSLRGRPLLRVLEISQLFRRPPLPAHLAGDLTVSPHAPHRSTSWDPKDGPGGRTWEKHLGDF